MKIRSSGVLALLTLVCLALMVANFDLQRQVRKLAKKNSELTTAQGPVVGSKIRSIIGYNMQNEPLRVDYSHQAEPSLIFLLSPQCAYCDQNWKYWRRLLGDAKGTKVVFIDSSGQVNPQYFASAGIPIPENVVKVGIDMKIAYNLSTVPATIVCGPNGEVKGTWVGVLDDDSVSAIESLLKA